MHARVASTIQRKTGFINHTCATIYHKIRPCTHVHMCVVMMAQGQFKTNYVCALSVLCGRVVDRC